MCTQSYVSTYHLCITLCYSTKTGELRAALLETSFIAALFNVIEKDEVVKFDDLILVMRLVTLPHGQFSSTDPILLLNCVHTKMMLSLICWKWIAFLYS